MMKKIWMTAFAGAFSAVWLFPQSPQPAVKATFVPSQQPEVIGDERGAWIAVEPSAVQAVSGRPFSATQTTKTVQTLGDGTEITNSGSTQLYRDVLGRTRTESTVGGKMVVVVRDPANGVVLRMSPETKEAVRATVPARGGRSGAMVSAEPRAAAAPMGKKKARGPDANTEDLGIQNINGIPALGTRRTQIIPAGQIGNNREIRVVNERWYSEDLQMLVKSVNSDPRFGVTTFELTNISRDNPDSSLFEVPAGYTVTEAPARETEYVLRQVVTVPTVKKNQ